VILDIIVGGFRVFFIYLSVF